MKTGRPLKFQSVEELEQKIDAYFEDCKIKGSRPFITELAYWLDTSRETLCDYKEKPEFSDSLKKAKARCEIELERNLIEGKINPTGSIFNLKNNYGWKDRQETDITSGNKPISILGGISHVPKDDGNGEDIGA